jgi:hypothetical protein
MGGERDGTGQYPGWLPHLLECPMVESSHDLEYFSHNRNNKILDKYSGFIYIYFPYFIKFFLSCRQMILPFTHQQKI